MDDDSRRNWLQRAFVIGRILAFIVCCSFLLIIANPVMSHFAGIEKDLAIGVVTALGTFALTLVFTKLDCLSLKKVGANFEWQSLVRFFIGFAIGLVIVGVWAAATYVAGYVRWQRTQNIGAASVALSLLLYVALASREELAFHGYPLRRMQMAWGVWPAQMFIAALFAIEHLLGRASWIDAFVGSAFGSLLFGVAAIATEGLAIPIGLHAAWNTGHWALGFKSNPGLLQPLGGTEHESAAYAVAMISYVAVFAVATFGFWLFYRHRDFKAQMIGDTQR
jgi:uncharacterized protein